ncbi:hypothetical protein EJ04DRAFT_526963 [Polyplosphaeria fusca]|uniref:BTB domain-containing protein n=1 Tax=Polyplosphaeria fusca TaxID=682080 RepID=A0A9P4UYV8_9PLEO|nr:hypothetical protein EJ04DRAFT_526963 [Polyplosphaeria fusca]
MLHFTKSLLIVDLSSSWLCRLDSEVVSILVGTEPAQRKFSIHQSVAIKSSEYFARALNGAWKENEDKCIEFPEILLGHLIILRVLPSYANDISYNKREAREISDTDPAQTHGDDSSKRSRSDDKD